MTKQYDEETIEGMCNAVFGSLVFAYRDTDLTVQQADKYQKGMIIMERGFVDSSAKGGGLARSHRYLILSSNNRNLSALEMETDWGLCNIASGSYFKVIDIYRVADKTQISLLHIPADTVDFFNRYEVNIEAYAVEEARKNFDRNLQSVPVAELESEEWIERVSTPLGMDDEGYLFLEIAPPNPPR